MLKGNVSNYGHMDAKEAKEPVFLGNSASAAPPHVLFVFVCYVWVRINPTVFKTVGVVLPQVVSVISVSVC